MKPGCGGAVSRSAGTYAQLVGKDGGYALVKIQCSLHLHVGLVGMAHEVLHILVLRLLERVDVWAKGKESGPGGSTPLWMSWVLSKLQFHSTTTPGSNLISNVARPDVAQVKPIPK